MSFARVFKQEDLPPMSFDLAVWKDDDERARYSDSEAGAIYVGLCNAPHVDAPAEPEIEGFYRDLTRNYPELDDVQEKDVDNCPWSVKIDRPAHHVVMSCVWSRAEEIRSFVLQLAKKYNLILFDPQEDAVLWHG